ncbi:MAG: DUF3488 and transglutaminase-like domain-containing protein, partial [Propionibacteriaceae bacterium]|nr:DUF3488 and transglutaminase-like domain-containing protein [Propionibacteriaceae bacterium]
MKRQLAASGLVTACFAMSACSLLAVLLPGQWLALTLGGIVLVGTLMGAARLLNLWLAPPLGLLAAACYSTWACSPEDAWYGFIPTSESVSQLWDALQLSFHDLMIANPLDPNPDVAIPVTVTGFTLAAVAVLLIGVDVGSPALAGILVFAPTLFATSIVPGEALAWAGLQVMLWLALLACLRPGPLRANGEPWPFAALCGLLATAMICGGTLTALAKETPLWGSELPTWTRFTDSLRGTSSEVGVGIDMGIDLTRSLREAGDEVLLRVTPLAGPDGSLPPAGGVRLRLETRADFDGVRWAQSTEEPLPVANPEYEWLGEPYPQPEFPTPRRQALTGLRVAVAGLATDRLPTVADPRQFAGLPGGLVWYEASDTAALQEPLPAGAEYEIWTEFLDAGSLADVAPGSWGSAQRKFTAHATHIALMAVLIAAGEDPDNSTNWSKANTARLDGSYAEVKRVETWLRTAGFTYTLNVPEATTGDTVWEFLQRRTGYCVHFATAMALMTELLGFQSRIAVGLLPGAAVAEDGTWEVTGNNVHAWTEVYFPNYGWLAFEPTPGFAIEDGQVRPSPAPSASASPSPSPTDSQASPSPSPSASGATQPQPGFDAGPWLPGLYAAGGLLALLALVGAALLLRTLVRARATAERVFAKLRRKYVRPLELDDTLTVRATAALIAATLPDEPSRQAWLDLAALV